MASAMGRNTTDAQGEGLTLAFASGSLIGESRGLLQQSGSKLEP